MDNNRKLYNYLAERYDLRQQNPATQLLRSKEKLLIKKYSKGTVLDLGCGTGYHLASVENAIGVDISEKMLKLARNKGRSIIQGNIERLPIKTGSVDTVFCFYGTLNLIDCQKFGKEVSRIAKRGGKIILSVASLKDMDRNGRNRSEDRFPPSKESKIKKFRLEGKQVNMRLLEKSEIVEVFENCGFMLKEFSSIFRIQKPRWGNFQKFSFQEKLKLKTEKIFPKAWGRIYFLIFQK